MDPLYRGVAKSSEESAPPTPWHWILSSDLEKKVTFMAALDALFHVTAWILAIVLDHLLFSKADGWSKIVPPATAAVDSHTMPYAMAALICSWIGFGTLLAIVAFKFFKFDPMSMSVAIVFSAARASMVFTLVITLFTVGVTVERGDEWRNNTIIAIIFKLFIVAKLQKNETMQVVKK